ncbi:T9SS type A sorting domain-containing protein [Rufibacter immobilis]|nr:T9SS type A sorting domain-containing protein [Rufibacter immobilis]
MRFSLALMFLMLWFATVEAEAQTVFASVRNGSFESSTTWDQRRVPSKNDIIIIKHAVVLTQDFLLGENGKGEIQVTATGVFTTGQNGKLRIRGNNSRLENDGRVELRNLALGVNGSDSAFFLNNNEAVLTENPEFKLGSIINNGQLTFQTSSSVTLEKVALRNTSAGTVSFSGSLQMNGGATMVNRGAMFMNAQDGNAFIVNQGVVENYGTIQVAGGLNMASAPIDKSLNNVSNYGTLSASSIYLNNKASLQNFGKMICKNDFTASQSTVINHPCATIEQSTQGRAFENRNSGAVLINNGFIKVNGNFTNISQAVLNGSGTLHIYGYSMNSDQAKVEGTLNIYDPSAFRNTIMDEPRRNGATMASTVKAATTNAVPSCGAPCEKPKVTISGPAEMCNLSEEMATFTVGEEQANTTYTYNLPEGFLIFGGEGTGTISVIAFLEEGQLNRPLEVSVTATNSCGSTTSTMQVTVKECVTATPLPVTLINFTATAQNAGKVQLNWATASEINNKEFVVEQSTDGLTFTSAKTVAGGGNSNVQLNYTATVGAPAIGVVYYRLKQVDFDGSSEYSKIVSVQVKGAAAQSSALKLESAYPNPFQDKVTLNLNVTQAGAIKVVFYTLTGQVAYTKEVFSVAGTSLVEINDLSHLAKGMYVVKITWGTQTESLRLVKSN